MSKILYINRSESQCGECNRYTSPHASACAHCGAEWDTVSSMYTGRGIERQIMAMRPDLEPYFPWSDFWETEEGQMTIAELTMDTRQDADSND